MKIKAAVLYAMEAKPPFAESRPLSIEEIDLARPGPQWICRMPSWSWPRRWA
jgi:alcohol dehydrogenase